MTSITSSVATDASSNRSGYVTVGDAELWFDQRGTGPDVLLIAGLGDPAEAWELQLSGLADEYRLTAFDNRGAGRSPLPADGFTVADMADDAAALMAGLGIHHAHVAGFSGGSATAQELALRHPDVVDSLVLVSTWARADRYFSTFGEAMAWLPDLAPSARSALEAFFLWIYTPRAHESGMVGQIIDDALAFPHPQSPEAFRRQLETWMAHDTLDRLDELAVPTLVVAGALDIVTPPRYGRDVADRIPGAELVVLDDEAHQPFQEQPEDFNAMVRSFWRRVHNRRS